MITIDKEFQSLIPPLSEDEFRQLEENCVKEGIRDALIVWETPNGSKVLVDGHNRFQIAARHGLHWNEKTMQFTSRDEARVWIIRNQFGRRNLSAYDRSVLALKLKPIIAEQAKERMAEAPHKKAEREKEIKKIWESHDFDTARNLVALKRQTYGREDRANLMASGKFIYFARFDGNKLKIGSSVCPEDRVKQLAISCPGLELIEAVFYGEGAEKHENAIKKKYGQYRFGSECYQCSDEILSQIIAFTKKEAGRKNNTDYELAKIAGVSHDTIHKVEQIEKHATPDIKRRVREGSLSINQGFLSTRPKQDMKAQIEKAKEEHEDFLASKKDSPIIDLRAVSVDESNQKLIAHGLMSEVERILNTIEAFSFKHKPSELSDIKKVLTKEEMDCTIDRLGKSISALQIIRSGFLKEVNS